MLAALRLLVLLQPKAVPCIGDAVAAGACSAVPRASARVPLLPAIADDLLPPSVRSPCFPSHPGYFGKVGMRYFHKSKSLFFCPTINVEKLHTLISEAARTKPPAGKAPVIDCVSHGIFKVLGKGEVPCALVVKAKFFTKDAEKKIKAAGGACVLVG